MQKKSIKVNTILNIIKTCSSIIFPLITFPYVSRVLQPESIGKVNFGTSYVSYFSLIASLGVATYAIRECSKVRDNKEQLNKKASQIYSINTCTTIVAYVLLALSLVFFRKVDSYRTLITIQSLTIAFTTIGADWINSAMEDFAYITIRTIVFQVLSLLLIFIFVRKPEDYIIYAIITVISSSGANLMNYFYRKKYCTIKFRKDMEWKRHFAPIFYLFVMILAQTIFSNADTTMLGLMRSDHEVGIYSTAVKMLNLIAQIVSSIAWVLMPRLSKYFAEADYQKINGLLKKALSTLLTIGIPCAIGAMCMSEDIVLLIAGDEYAGADTVLSILMISLLFSFVGGSFLGNLVLLPSQKEKAYMIICCVAAVFNVVANFILIPKFGVNGASATTAASSFLIMILLIFSVDKRICLRSMLKVAVAPFLGALAIVATCTVLKSLISNSFMELIVCVVASAMVYFVIQVRLKNTIVTEIIGTVMSKVRKK